MNAESLERLRQICIALPEVTERLSHGEPAWFVRGKKMFVMLSDHHHGDERYAFWCAAAPGETTALVAENSDKFFVPPYVGQRGWLGVNLDHEPLDWEEITELVTDAYRQVAPKTLLKKIEEPHD